MHVEFYKYQGTGNDFVILDNRKGKYSGLTIAQVRRICDRRFGVGADGLMMLNDNAQYDFEMKYYNADGKESSMCGNGGRCLVKFAQDMGIMRSNYSFIAADGPHEASINIDGIVSLKMQDVSNIDFQRGHFILNTGSPHYVEVTTEVNKLDVFKRGQEIRYSPEFEKEGINVNFVEQLGEPDRILVRTYERGVEDETYSCGTGVTAAALVCHHNDNGFNRVEIKTLGGELSVEYDKIDDAYKNIWLNGPAERVFDGTIEIY